MAVVIAIPVCPWALGLSNRLVTIASQRVVTNARMQDVDAFSLRQEDSFWGSVCDASRVLSNAADLRLDALPVVDHLELGPDRGEDT